MNHSRQAAPSSSNSRRESALTSPRFSGEIGAGSRRLPRNGGCLNAPAVMCIALIFCLALPSVTPLKAADPQLRGIVCFSGQRSAIIDFRGDHMELRTPNLRQGESEGGYKVTAIDERIGQVTLRGLSSGRVLELKLDMGPDEESADRTFLLHSVNLSTVLDLYQEISMRTVNLAAGFGLSRGQHRVGARKRIVRLCRAVSGR